MVLKINRAHSKLIPMLALNTGTREIETEVIWLNEERNIRLEDTGADMQPEVS